MTDGWTEQLQVFCVDVGSISRGKFAWARRHPGEEGDLHDPGDIRSLAAAVQRHLSAEDPVALGFEMPLFLPVPDDVEALGKRRPVDVGAPAWSSQIGACALATGIVQTAWLLKALRDAAPGAPLFLEWSPFSEQRFGLLLWEAFVSGKAKGASDEEDAIKGIEAFCAQLPEPDDGPGTSIQRPFSIAAAAAIWAGWDLPTQDLREAGIVVRAKEAT